MAKESSVFIAMHPDTAKRLRHYDALIRTGKAVLVGYCSGCIFMDTPQCQNVRRSLEKDEHEYGCTLFSEGR